MSVDVSFRTAWPAGHRRFGTVWSVVRRAGLVVREGGRAILGGLDGLLIGLTLAFLAFTTLSAPATYLGFPWPLEMLVIGGAVTLGTGVAAGVAVLAKRLLLLAGRGLDRWLSGAPVRARRLVALPFRVVGALPAGWMGGFALVLWLGMVGHTIGPLGLFVPSGALSPYIYVTGIIVALVGVARVVVRPSVLRPLGRPRLGIAGFAVGAAVLLAGTSTFLLVSPGNSAALVAPDPSFDGIPVATDLDDPGATGPYAVTSLSYGSGTDARRDAFGAGADLVTPTIDASAILHPLGSWADEARQWFWGFGTSAMPLNGLVWMPQGDGPFPLVLMVHGNHAMGDFSEPGYDYLGAHLASRGLIAVSVDEDFLNGSWAGDWQGAEQLARSWFLLLHLDQWRAWNADPASPFHGKVDLGRVALIGHSRGGEAATVAAVLARHAAPPRTGLAPWPTGLSIRAVVAIAPSDGQYGPGVSLEGTDLLELSGGHDSDCRGWIGIRQYARTTVSGSGVRAALWSYRSNHGQFSSVWGRSDQGPYGGALLNLAPLLDDTDQQDVAKTAIGAFLAASLQGQDGYLGFFRRPMIGREWLPDDVYLVRSLDGRFEHLTGTNPAQPVAGVTATYDGFTDHRALVIPLRALQSDQGMLGLRLRWPAGVGEASWGLSGFRPIAESGGATELRLSIANGSEPGSGVLDPLVELSTTDGVSVSLPLSRWASLPPPLTVSLVKNDLLASISGVDLSVRSSVERVLQTYAIPLAEYAAANPAFQTSHLDAFRLRIDRAAPGGLWIAEIGLERPDMVTADLAN